MCCIYKCLYGTLSFKLRHVKVFRRLRVLLAGNHTQQDAIDRVKVGGVDERVGAVVEKPDDHNDMVAECTDFELRVDVQKQAVHEPAGV